MLTGSSPTVSPAPHHGPHPLLLFFMVVSVANVNQCFFHRDLIVFPALSEASSVIEFTHLCSLVIPVTLNVFSRLFLLEKRLFRVFS